MGWFYGAAIYTKNTWGAQSLVGKYAGQTFVFNNTEVCRLRAYEQFIQDGYWVNIYPKEVTRSGIANEEEAKKANEFCNVMYGMLRNDVNFDYAICGVEVDEFRTLEELIADFRDGSVMKLDGLVVSHELFKEVPVIYWNGWEAFSPTHWWLPKKLEMVPG